MNVPKRQSRFERGENVVVMKFGGTSVEDATAIRRLIGIVQSRSGQQPVVVVSALAKVTDQLLEAGKGAASGHLGAALAAVRDIYVRHEKLADSLVEGSAYSGLDRELRGEFRKLESLLCELERSRSLNPRLQDLLLGFGECFSSRLVTEALCAAGIVAASVDARSCVITDAHHGSAVPLWDECNIRVQDAVGPVLESGRVPVLGGFIASTLDGIPTTLGRGGSDFTAAILGAALCASRIEIWTDVDGVMTADPKLCPQARVIRRMNFDEAEELARCGAKVLHPATLAPAKREHIPVWVLNSRRPENPGTEISNRARGSEVSSAIAARRNITAVEIEASGAIDSELIRAVFAAFDRHSSPIELIATSFGRISVFATSADRLPAIAEDLHGVAAVRWETHKVLVSLVGESVRRQLELADQAFAAVSNLNPRVVGPFASDRTISFLAEDALAAEVVQRLHGLLVAKPKLSQDWGEVSVAYCQAGFSPRSELPAIGPEDRRDKSLPA